MDELGFIEALRTLPLHPGARSLRDDAAVLQIGSETLIVTHDVMVEGVHYLLEQDMADVAWKLVAVNLSDLAAKGAEPIGVVLGHSLGKGDERFIEGLREALDVYGVKLLGGDTVSGGAARSHGLTAIGRATFVPVPSRASAKPGDAIYITGPLGAAMRGFETVRDGGGGDASSFLRPKPLLREGRTLAPMVTAMMDISDGLLLDASRMAEASGVTFALENRDIPFACPDDRRDDALRWGEDFQLLFTAPPSAALPVPAHRIGQVTARGEHRVLLDGQPADASRPLGYVHRG